MIMENGFSWRLPALAGLSLLACWRRRAEQRAALGRLLETSPHLIDDLGLDRREALAEAGKRFWQD
ncbi:MAG: hypothetical protein J0H82_34695 [Alphaproteobacteria bacterium]|jgi:uncharacterized protein YjiS (DUF1127 family)|nr:hypothetical protein [Alphaproteobacteria bacterium]